MKSGIGRNCRSQDVKGTGDTGVKSAKNTMQRVRVAAFERVAGSPHMGRLRIRLSENKRGGVIIHGDIFFLALGRFEILFCPRSATSGEETGYDVDTCAIYQPP